MSIEPLNLKILSWNIAGIDNPSTSKSKINAIKTLYDDIDIIFLQETHAKNVTNHFIQLHYQLPLFTWIHCHNSHNTRATRGVSIGFKNNKIILKEIITSDPWGRGLSIKCTYQKQYIQLTSIYCPKEDLPNLYHAMPIKTICTNHIIGGDFNSRQDTLTTP